MGTRSMYINVFRYTYGLCNKVKRKKLFSGQLFGYVVNFLLCDDVSALAQL
jgi:hypothetical protein